MEVSKADEPFPKRRSRSFYPVNFMQTESVFPSTVEEKSKKERESKREKERERKKEERKERKAGRREKETRKGLHRK